MSHLPSQISQEGQTTTAIDPRDDGVYESIRTPRTLFGIRRSPRDPLPPPPPTSPVSEGDFGPDVEITGFVVTGNDLPLSRAAEVISPTYIPGSSGLQGLDLRRRSSSRENVGASAVSTSTSAADDGYDVPVAPPRKARGRPRRRKSPAIETGQILREELLRPQTPVRGQTVEELRHCAEHWRKKAISQAKRAGQLDTVNGRLRRELNASRQIIDQQRALLGESLPTHSRLIRQHLREREQVEQGGGQAQKTGDELLTDQILQAAAGIPQAQLAAGGDPVTLLTSPPIHLPLHPIHHISNCLGPEARNPNDPALPISQNQLLGAFAVLFCQVATQFALHSINKIQEKGPQ